MGPNKKSKKRVTKKHSKKIIKEVVVVHDKKKKNKKPKKKMMLSKKNDTMPYDHELYVVGEIAAVGSQFQVHGEVYDNPWSGSRGPIAEAYSRLTREYSTDSFSIVCESMESAFTNGFMWVAWSPDIGCPAPTSFQEASAMAPYFAKKRLGTKGNMTLSIPRTALHAAGSSDGGFRITDPDEHPATGALPGTLSYTGKYWYGTVGVGSVSSTSSSGTVAYVAVKATGKYRYVRVDQPSEANRYEGQISCTSNVSKTNPLGDDPQFKGKGIEIGYEQNHIAETDTVETVVSQKFVQSIINGYSEINAYLQGTGLDAMSTTLPNLFLGSETQSVISILSLLNGAGGSATIGNYKITVENSGNPIPEKTAPSFGMSSIIDTASAVLGIPGLGTLGQSLWDFGTTVVGSLFGQTIQCQTEQDLLNVVRDFYKFEIAAHNGKDVHFHFFGIPRNHLQQHLWSSQLCFRHNRKSIDLKNHVLDQRKFAVITDYSKAARAVRYIQAIENSKKPLLIEECKDVESVIDSDFRRGVAQSPLSKTVTKLNKFGLTIMLLMCFVIECFATTGTTPVFLTSIPTPVADRPNGGCLAANIDTNDSGQLSLSSNADYIATLGVFTTITVETTSHASAVVGNCCYATVYGSSYVLAIVCSRPGQSETITLNDVGGVDVNWGYSNLDASYAGTCCFSSFTHFGTAFGAGILANLNSALPVDLKTIDGKSLPSSSLPITAATWSGSQFVDNEVPVDVTKVNGNGIVGGLLPTEILNEYTDVPIPVTISHWNVTHNHLNVNIDAVGGIKHDDLHSDNIWHAPFLPVDLRSIGDDKLMTFDHCNAYFDEGGINPSPTNLQKCLDSQGSLPVTTFKWAKDSNGDYINDLPMRVDNYQAPLETVPKFFTKRKKQINGFNGEHTGKDDVNWSKLLKKYSWEKFNLDFHKYSDAKKQFLYSEIVKNLTEITPSDLTDEQGNDLVSNFWKDLKFSHDNP